MRKPSRDFLRASVSPWSTGFFKAIRFPARLAAIVPLLFALAFPEHAAAALFAAEGKDIRAEIQAAKL